MRGKLPSVISHIDVTKASYAESHQQIEPTFVNFFFGNNGTGKSTIARALKSGEGVTYVGGKTRDDYLTLVYDQAFIDEHFQSYHNMKGVYTLNARNAQIQTQVDTLTAEMKSVRSQLDNASKTYQKQCGLRTQITVSFYKDCWDREKKLLSEFPEIKKGRGKSEPFTKEVMNHSPQDTDLEELRRLYESAYSSSARRYERFNPVSDPTAFERLDGLELLSVPIVNSADTQLAEFLRGLDATEWMREGHDKYTEKAGGKCPYCQRELPTDFERMFIDSFDDRYQKNLERLKLFLAAYRQQANSLFVPLQATPADVYPKIDMAPYSDKLMLLKTTIQENITRIQNKIANPAQTVVLTDLTPILEALSTIIRGFNKLIDENNAVVEARPKKRAECTNRLFSLFAFHLRDAIAYYKKSIADMNADILATDQKISGYKETLRTTQEKLLTLRSQTVETETAKESINRMLRDSGMQGFSLQPKKGVDHVYEVCRPDGSVASDLSEGEKNFIAFLYFYHRVCGSGSAEGDTKEKIVVIDDPVSSMDSGSLFLVSTLVRQMIEVCRNNADNRNRKVDGNFIKQIFILTHNTYFHREITYSYVDRYDYVSFYLIRKVNSKSTVRFMDLQNPKVPSERMNVNPVKNSYAALWDEYKELQSAVPLLSVIRRILEYYFMQLCGYEGSTLREAILTKGKAEGRYKKPDGSDDDERYLLASAMLAYINAGSIGMNDGMDFVEGSMDVDECRSVFEMIFEIMDQRQHYDMMMRSR